MQRKKKVSCFMQQLLKDVFTFTAGFMYKKIFYIGAGAYLVMFLLSLVYYKERIIFADTAFFLFNIVKDNSFCVQVYRFGDVFSQVFAVAARKAAMPLDTIAKCYSVGFIFYHFVCYAICGAVLKEYKYALAILLVNLLFTTETFYWTISQLPQGLSLLLVLLAAIAAGKKKTISLARGGVVFALLVTLLFFHPLLVIPLVFALAYFFPKDYAHLDKRLVAGIGIVGAVILAAKVALFKTPYEQHSASGLKNFVTLFPNYFTTHANAAFLKKCITDYVWIPLTFTAVSIVYVKEKRWRDLLLFLVFFFGYLLLINVSYYSNDTPGFYIESLYAPLAFFLVVPLVFDVLPLSKNLGFLVVGLVAAMGCARIYFAHNPYTARLDYERELLHVYKSEKIILDAGKTDTELLQMLWGAPYEFWLLSQTEQGHTASIIIDKDPKARGWAAMENKRFVVNWNLYPYKDLPAQYFSFPDTTSGYTIDH
jgi:hypothetical protein